MSGLINLLFLPLFQVSDKDIYDPAQFVCSLPDGKLVMIDLKNYANENSEQLNVDKMIADLANRLGNDEYNKLVQNKPVRAQLLDSDESEVDHFFEKKSSPVGQKRLSQSRMPFRIGRK
jgi:hypothetical protein